MQIIAINEIFKSIQGEGFHTGTPCIFVRFQGCENNCPFCDTPHAQDRKKANYYIDEVEIENRILHHIGSSNIRRVVITGGEPFLQDVGLRNLINNLLGEGFLVSIETSGTVELSEDIKDIFAMDVWLTLSPKHKEPYLQYKLRANEIKVLVGMNNVFMPTTPVSETAQLFFQPVWTDCAIQRTSVWKRAIQLCYEHGARLSPQMHKYLNIP